MSVMSSVSREKVASCVIYKEVIQQFVVERGRENIL